jgi:hypothetical protein
MYKSFGQVNEFSPQSNDLGAPLAPQGARRGVRFAKPSGVGKGVINRRAARPAATVGNFPVHLGGERVRPKSTPGLQDKFATLKPDLLPEAA